MLIEDILKKKALIPQNEYRKNNGLRLEPGQRRLANKIYKMYQSPQYFLVEEFMEELKHCATKPPYIMTYLPGGLDSIFKECEAQNLIKRQGYSLSYKINVNYAGVIEFIQKNFATFAVIDELKSRMNQRIDEIYYDVKLKDRYTGASYHVDVMYRIGGTLYFIVIFLNKGILDQNPSMIERVNRSIFNPVNRLRTNVSVVISPSANVKGLIKILRDYKNANAEMPTVVKFNNLDYLISSKF